MITMAEISSGRHLKPNIPILGYVLRLQRLKKTSGNAVGGKELKVPPMILSMSYVGKYFRLTLTALFHGRNGKHTEAISNTRTENLCSWISSCRAGKYTRNVYLLSDTS